MSLRQWADGHQGSKSVDWWCMWRKHTQENKRVLERSPEVVSYDFKIFRSIFLLSIWGVLFAQLLFGNRPFPTLQAIQIGLTFLPFQPQGCDLSPSKQIMTTIFIRSMGKRCFPSAVMVKWAGCKSVASEDYLCHPTGTLYLRMKPTCEKAEQHAKRDGATVSGWHWRKRSSTAWLFPLCFSYLSK